MVSISIKTSCDFCSICDRNFRLKIVYQFLMNINIHRETLTFVVFFHFISCQKSICALLEHSSDVFQIKFTRNFPFDSIWHIHIYHSVSVFHSHFHGSIRDRNGLISAQNYIVQRSIKV